MTHRKDQPASNDMEIDIHVHDPEKEAARKEWRLHEFNVLTIIAVLAIITVFMLFGKRPTKSAEENRDLTACPKFSVSSYLDGTFTSEFAKFFNDTVPMRSTWKAFIAGFRAHLGIPYDDVVIHGSIPVIENDQDPAPAATTEATTEAPVAVETVPGAVPAATDAAPAETEAPTEATTEAETEPQEDDGEIANNILIVKNRGVMLYGGSHSGGERYAELVNEYKTRMGADVNVWSMVAPTAVSFYLPKKFASASASETENIDYLNGFLQDVTPIDAFSALEPHKDEPIYSRTDHHWAPIGAFYAAEQFAKDAGVPFAPLSDYEEVVKPGYVGTLYGFTNSQAFLDDPEDFIYYKPTADITTTYYDIDMTNEREAPLMLNIDKLEPVSWYLVFMGGDERVTHVETATDNDRVLCIIKDSYGNALVPCLTSSFEEIWVVDMRYFEPNIISFMKDKGVTDVLFAMNTFSATGQNAQKLRTLLDQ